MPPLCVVGLLLGARAWREAVGALLLFGTNFLGIALACMVVYIIAGRVERRSRSTLIVTGAVVAVLTFPLAASFLEISREARIEAQIRHELTVDTVTFKHTRLAGAVFDWYAHPLQARLDVRSESTISAAQVHDLEAFLAQRIGRPITLVLDVSRYDIVTGSASPPALPAAP